METELVLPTFEQAEQIILSAGDVVEDAEMAFFEAENSFLDALAAVANAAYATGYAAGVEEGSHFGARSALDAAQYATEPETSTGMCGVPGCDCSIDEVDELELPDDSLLLLGLDADLYEFKQDMNDFQEMIVERLEAIELAIGLKYTGDQAD